MGPTNSNLGQNNGVYGTLGSPGAANVAGPGGRQNPVVWADNQGSIWVFGGLGLDSLGTRNPGSLNGLTGGTVTAEGALLNDLWKFDGTNWIWMGGSQIGNGTGSYGTMGTASASNLAASRVGAVSWIDASGNLWLFGGLAEVDPGGATAVGNLNDLWRITP